LNISVFFHGFTKEGALQNKKPCARWRDAERNAASVSGDPAMVFNFRMASILSLQVTGTLPVTSSGRIAAGHWSRSMSFLHHAPWRIIDPESCSKQASDDHAKTRG
jgi:hypothetical protein